MIIAGISVIPIEAQVIQNSNLQLWFRADAGVSVDGSGTNVTQWADQSANANHALQTALTPPTSPIWLPGPSTGCPRSTSAARPITLLPATPR